MISDNHKLTDNDKDIIKMWEKTKNKKCTPFMKKTLTLFSILYRGLHHMPYDSLRRMDLTAKQFIEYDFKGVLATTDFNTLTRLVFAAHDLALRVELGSTTKHCIQMYIHSRTHKKKNIDNVMHHPTLKQAVTWWNQ